MEAILDTSAPINVELLDRVTAALTGPESAHANIVLTRFKENPETWQQVPDILMNSKSLSTKFIALQILDTLIQTRWKILPMEQREGIRNFIVSAIMDASADEQALKANRTYLGKLNLILVQILKHDWQTSWSGFIPEIVDSSKKGGLSRCENNMTILKLLSEEIFDFSADQMTQQKIKDLKVQMCAQLTEVFQLCLEVLEKAQKASLVKATLETMLRFLNWIPLGYIFETNIIDTLVNRFLEVPDFRNITLKCLSEIGGLTNVASMYDPKFVTLFTMVMTSINRIIPLSTDIQSIYDDSNDSDQELVKNLCQFLVNFLSAHLKLIEGPETRDVLVNAHMFLLNISQVNDREIFKSALEYWHILVEELYDETVSMPATDMNPLLGLGTSSNSFMNSAGSARKQTYDSSGILSMLRVVMIDKMVKPEEVLIVENDEGEIVREFLKETDTIVLYNSMRKVLVYLTHLDINDTDDIMIKKLARQVDDSEWSWNRLNTLCWAIGSISGTMSVDTEKKFVVTVIKDLLALCEMKKGKDNKAVVASNIMYIVGQYPGFLRAHWKFLKTVVNKNFEFMHESHTGVQDMACDTFIKISKNCRKHFILLQSGEQEPFIDEILRNLHRTTADLSPAQMHTFYEACGYMIASQPNKNIQENLISKLMELPNNAWTNIIARANENISVLTDADTAKIVSNILKTNVSACTSIGSFFLPQISYIYLDLLGLYKAVSGIISDSITAEIQEKAASGIVIDAANPQGLVATKTPKIRNLRTIKKEILKLIDVYVRKAEDMQVFYSQFIMPLFEAILGDYKNNIAPARDAEVLNMLNTIVNRLEGMLNDSIPAILDSVFECTLSMINKDFAEYPEHRVAFFKLLRSINIHCFQALLKLPPAQFKMTMDSVVWGIKHTMRDIAELGLNLALEVINNVTSSGPDVSNPFFQRYFLSILQDIFFVLTDTDHKSGFKLQALVLSRLYHLVATDQIQAPLFDPTTQAAGMSNSMFLKSYTLNLLSTAFPNLNAHQVERFVVGLFELNTDSTKFKSHLRDFLIQLKEFQGDDNTDLFIEEKESAQKALEIQARAQATNVPGMLKPSEADIDEDL